MFSTVAPNVRPWRMSATVVIGAVWKDSALSCETEFPISRRLEAPAVPVTMTPSRLMASERNSKSWTTAPSAVTVTSADAME